MPSQKTPGKTAKVGKNRTARDTQRPVSSSTGSSTGHVNLALQMGAEVGEK